MERWGIEFYKVLSFEDASNNYQFVTPAQAGVQYCWGSLDSCFRRNDILRGGLKLLSFEFV